MDLTSTDRKILESYCDVAKHLSEYLGPSYEIVLHSLENYEHAVIAIYHGEHTGRSVGAPITDIALSMLDSYEASGASAPYFGRAKDGKPLKSTTIPIVGERGRVIGLLCINLYLGTPLSDIIAGFVPDLGSADGLPERETFASQAETLIRETLRGVRDDVFADATVLPSMRNKAIVERLYRKGMFKMKSAVSIVADELGISANTVYLHIRSARKDLG